MARSYLLFTTPFCPNCPSVKVLMKDSGLSGEIVDASKPEGLLKAQEFDVIEVPTVVFLEDGEVVSKVHGFDDIEEELKK